MKGMRYNLEYIQITQNFKRYFVIFEILNAKRCQVICTLLQGTSEKKSPPLGALLSGMLLATSNLGCSALVSVLL